MITKQNAKSNSWRIWELSKRLNLYYRRASPTFMTSTTEWRSHVVGWYHWVQTYWPRQGAWMDKVATAASCNILKEVWDLWLDDKLLSFLRNFLFMHDNSHSYFVWTTGTLLKSYGIQGGMLMLWPPASPDFNSFENGLFIIKAVYSDGRQFA